MWKLIAMTLASLAVSANGAAAEWLYIKGQDDPFKAGKEHLVLASGGGPISMGFRCTNGVDLALLMITPERPTTEMLKSFASATVKLLAIVDDQPKITMAGQLSATPDMQNLRFETDDDDVAGVVHAAAAAKKRIAIAGEVNGRIVYSQSFSAAGSRKALAQLIAGCSIEPPAPKSPAKTN